MEERGVVLGSHRPVSRMSPLLQEAQGAEKTNMDTLGPRHRQMPGVSGLRLASAGNSAGRAGWKKPLRLSLFISRKEAKARTEFPTPGPCAARPEITSVHALGL